jgi:hypothetical protein
MIVFPLIGKSISKANAFVRSPLQFAQALLLKQHAPQGSLQPLPRRFASFSL